MRFTWTAALPLLVLPASCAPQRAGDKSSDVVEDQPLKILEHSPSNASTKFALRCPGCFVRPNNAADDSLVFELTVNPSDDIWSSTVTINEQQLHFNWEDAIVVPGVRTVSGDSHTINLSWTAGVDLSALNVPKDQDVTQTIHFTATPSRGADLDNPPSAGFVAIMRPLGPTGSRLIDLMSDTDPRVVDYLDDLSATDPPAYQDGSRHSDSSSENDEFNLDAELESLALLESKADDIQKQISAKKKAIAANLKQDHDKLCLKQLIQECDGIICAAKAVAQRLCDKVGISTPPSFQYAKLRSQQTQNAINLDAKMNLPQSDCPGHMRHCQQSANLPLMLTKNDTSSAAYAFKPINIINPPNPLMRALQIIGAVTGLSALFLFLKRRCMSMRRRVERAADLEERRNERAYRRAARRALMRKRWDAFVNSINCFGRKEEPRLENYEEKRQLILQDAFLEQDLDQAEKGEIMEAEIRELRYAHEIVSSLVRVDEHRYDFVVPINDPPPPLVPLPAPRSRASTLYTLPSYTSETLPDYSSRRASDSEGSSSLVRYTPSESEQAGRISPELPRSDTASTHSRFTPDSSVRETSTRPSQETIRTRPSQPSEDE